MRASASQRRSDPWQRLLAIHQHLKRSPRSRRGDRRQPTAIGPAAVPADPSGQHAPAGDDDANRSSSRCLDPPIHQRAQPSHWPPTEPNPQAPKSEDLRPACTIRAPPGDATHRSDRRMSCCSWRKEAQHQTTRYASTSSARRWARLCAAPLRGSQPPRGSTLPFGQIRAPSRRWETADIREHSIGRGRVLHAVSRAPQSATSASDQWIAFAIGGPPERTSPKATNRNSDPSWCEP